MEETPVTLVDLAGGKVVQLFDVELEKVLENIDDRNTDPEAVREITIKARWKPNKDRNLAAVRVTATSKLAPVNPVGTVVFMARRGGQVVAVESNPEQLSLKAEVMPIRAVPSQEK